jgi:hypothetical protein
MSLRVGQWPTRCICPASHKLGFVPQSGRGITSIPLVLAHLEEDLAQLLVLFNFALAHPLKSRPSPRRFMRRTTVHKRTIKAPARTKSSGRHGPQSTFGEPTRSIRRLLGVALPGERKACQVELWHYGDGC